MTCGIRAPEQALFQAQACFMELSVGGWFEWWSDHYGCRGILLKNENRAAGNRHRCSYGQVGQGGYMRAAAMMSSLGHLSVILLFGLGLLLRFLSHLAVIAFTANIVCVCDRRNKQRKSNKK